MAFDGIFLSKLTKELNILKTGRISKVGAIGDTDFIFTIRANRSNYNLLTSFSTEFSRIHLTKEKAESNQTPKSFTLLLRKHIEGYFIEDINQYEADRVLVLKLSGFNEMQDKNTKYLICEIMGRYSNLILCDDEYTIIDALKHDGVGEYNRTIMPYAKYLFPTQNKINPINLSLDEIEKIFIEKKIDNPKTLINTFAGVSNTIAYPVFLSDSYALNFYKFLNEEIKPSYIKGFQDKYDYYFNNLSYETLGNENTLSDLLDNFYFKQDLQSKIKQKTGDLIGYLNKQISKHENKIEKLNMELSDTNKMDSYKLYGELLLSYPNIKEKKDNVMILNYYNNQEVKINLDPKISILENSNKYYKKYQKLKNSIPFIQEQIEISKSEIEYFKLLKYQLDDATLSEALDIQDELIKGKYLFKPLNNKGRKQKIHLLTYKVGDTLISVGKNNIQNEYLTHTFAKSNEMWFHVKDMPGSHVVVHASNLTDEEIRVASMLAAYYSSAKDSSSVQVDYTLIRNIKKIPGKRACFVTYKGQKSIYIDPDIEIIKKLEVVK